ncbi:DNA-binding response regulator [Tenuibacillus multivorans]|uniref:Two-component system, OmpR family, alkaline phosphatase synthesis response regulator PhoP n=1 Tax=Tenuibacillus multivorans TaxID=237069 RepID=A0A1G9ZSY7_9BACI|nr:response regulator transcription factor [Tenuibacillus multivorans]GEL76839.1 DNA-binding response regulator [Tenuibacillus multivorans]SDN24408.1 two-component system, OmpR family, alkaline phosphatase synthesis response regulator PhoP [Tenuibacillus multivorans]
MDTRILIVDDEESITTLIDYNLIQAGYRTAVVHDGETALQLATHENFDLILLDLMLPTMNGLEVCEKLREQGLTIPIIMLTAKGEEEDKITGLDVGADDYMTKPFSPKELSARIRAVLRRSVPHIQNEEVIKVKDIDIHIDTYEVFKNGQLVEFTKKEFDLLVYLAERRNKPVKREVLLQDVWDFDFIGDTRIVDVHISHLREKLEDQPKKPSLIKTVRGIGYKLEG